MGANSRKLKFSMGPGFEGLRILKGMGAGMGGDCKYKHLKGMYQLKRSSPWLPSTPRSGKKTSRRCTWRKKFGEFPRLVWRHSIVSSDLVNRMIKSGYSRRITHSRSSKTSPAVIQLRLSTQPLLHGHPMFITTVGYTATPADFLSSLSACSMSQGEYRYKRNPPWAGLEMFY